jgi:hypothetical protein
MLLSETSTASLGLNSHVKKETLPASATLQNATTTIIIIIIIINRFRPT